MERTLSLEITGFGLPPWQSDVCSSPGYAQNNDEYLATLVAPAPGIYEYAARFSVDGGESWTVCDLNGSNDGYQPENAGELIVAREAQDGDVVISEIMYDSSAVSDGVGEWFELQNVSGEAISLKTMVFSDEGSDSFTLADLGPLDTSPVMPAGAFFVFAKDGDEAVNGGVSATYVYGARMALANSADELIISNASGTLDQINWASSEVSNVVDGTSFLGADGLDPVGATITRSADGDGSWCAGDAAYGDGDLGTPGVENPNCEWTQGFVQQKLRSSCAGCHSTTRQDAWTMSTVYSRVRSDSNRSRMPKNGANGGYWTSSEVTKLCILVEGDENLCASRPDGT